MKRNPEKVASGTRIDNRRKTPRIVCSFGFETWKQIRNRAIKEHTSFGRQIRILVECGFLYLEDQE